MALNTVPLFPVEKKKITFSWENMSPRVQFEYFIKKDRWQKCHVGKQQAENKICILNCELQTARIPPEQYSAQRGEK